MRCGHRYLSVKKSYPTLEKITQNGDNISRMNNQVLLIIQFIFSLIFIWWFLSKRGRTPHPTVLNLEKDLEVQKELRNVKKIEGSPPKSLNVIFMWNGHTWDAFEVLGLAAGSSMDKVRQQFESLHVKSDSGQRKFLEEAYNSIRVKYNP